MNLDLITIGDSTIDTFIYPQEAETLCTLKPEEYLICFDYGDKVPLKDLAISIGGNAANHAVSAARFGLKVAIVTSVGDDLAGRQILFQLGRETVLTDWATTVQNGKTNHSIIISLGGERTILSYHVPRTYRLPPHLPQPTWIFLTSVGANFTTFYDQIINWATSHSIKLAFAPGSRQLRAPRDSLLPTLKATQIIFVNKQEAALLTTQAETADIKTLLNQLASLGPRQVVITDNIAGSYAFDGQNFYHCDALKVETQEITGAGDAYAAGVLTALIQNHPLPDALLRGTVNAASVVSHTGAQVGLLKAADLPSWLDKATKAKVKIKKI